LPHQIKEIAAGIYRDRERVHALARRGRRSMN
jgi:hypothetical protein